MNKQTDELMAQHDFEFERMLDIEPLRNCFQDYLISIHNEEPLCLLIELEKYISFVGSPARYKAAKDIIENFIVVGAPKEVNISNKSREEAILKFAASSTSQCDAEMFSNLRIAVYMEMKEDCFVGFLTSSHLLKHVQKNLKKDKNYLSKIGTPKPVTSVPQLPIVPQGDLRFFIDFTTPEIVDIDFDRIMARIEKEDDWDTFISAKGYTRSVSKNTVDGYKVAKDEMCFQCDHEEVFNVAKCSEYSDLIDAAVKIKYDYYQFIDNDKYRSVATNNTTRFPYPMSERYNPCVTAAKTLPNGDILVACKSVDKLDIPYNDKHVRTKNFSGWLFQKLEEGTCKYTFVVVFDLGGFMTPKIMNSLMSFQKSTVYDVINDVLKERKSIGIRGPDTDHPIYKSLLYHKSKQL
ncbi:RGS13 [Acrasis kona]|uniref:RGS13 n=1 Tax=Acrasis kona TaxID=1008807 RepID=A0AAW2ZD69_9EUKA